MAPDNSDLPFARLLLLAMRSVTIGPNSTFKHSICVNSSALVTMHFTMGSLEN